MSMTLIKSYLLTVLTLYLLGTLIQWGNILTFNLLALTVALLLSLTIHILWYKK